MKKVWDKWTRIALVKRILVGLILGAILGIAVPQATGIAILGDVFVSALKAIAPRIRPTRILFTNAILVHLSQIFFISLILFPFNLIKQ